MKENVLLIQRAVLYELNYPIFLNFCSWTTDILSYDVILLFIIISVDQKVGFTASTIVISVCDVTFSLLARGVGAELGSVAVRSCCLQ